MAGPVQGGWRTARAAVLAVSVVGLATTGHLVAGGSVASWRAVVLAVLLVAAGAALVTALRLTPGRAGVTLLAGQVVVHHALAWVPGGHCSSRAVGPAGQDAFAEVASTVCRPVEAHGHWLWSDPGMLAAHLLATAVTAVVVARADAVLWHVQDLLRLRPVRLAVAPVPAAALPPVPADRSGVVPAPRDRALTCDPLRGPPVPVASRCSA